MGLAMPTEAHCVRMGTVDLVVVPIKSQMMMTRPGGVTGPVIH
jgi:hypothetical protein